MWVAGLAVAGALAGMLLALITPRLVTGEGPLLVPSCPTCSRPLTPLDVLSWKSRCGHGPGWRGPLLVAGGAALGAVAGFVFPPGSAALYGSLALWVLLGASAADIGHRIIPDSLLVTGGIAAAGLLFLLPRASYVSHLEGMGLLFGITFLVALVSGGGLGGGDVKLAAYIGLALGLVPGVTAFLAGGMFGGLYGVGLLVLRKKTLRDTFAFGPFLAAGAALVLLLAPALSGL